MPDYPGTRQHQHDADTPDLPTAAGDTSDPGYERVGQLDRDDIVALILSAVLVVATFWLATRIL